LARKYGHPGLIGLETEYDGMVKSYHRQVAEGQRKDGRWARLSYLAKANYAHLYINRLRRHSNEAAYLNRAGSIERRLLQPWHRASQRTARAEKFDNLDYYVERSAIPLEHIHGLRAALFDQTVYYDPYVVGYEHHGRAEESHHPFLYMDSQTLFANPHFLHICANQEIIAFCREVLGPRAALSWAWSWITNPVLGINYQNQNWHRDSSEPLNFVRIFVPLQDIAGLDDGPTALIPGSSHETAHREVRRFTDDDLAEVQARRGAGMIQADAGDVYFVNTMALHRGVPPVRRRAILSLLVSLSPSHRTPGIVPLQFSQFPEAVRDTVAANRRFFRYLIK
jgi:hypothetical protein